MFFFGKTKGTHNDDQTYHLTEKNLQGRLKNSSDSWNHKDSVFSDGYDDGLWVSVPGRGKVGLKDSESIIPIIFLFFFDTNSEDITIHRKQKDTIKPCGLRFRTLQHDDGYSMGSGGAKRTIDDRIRYYWVGIPR